MTLTLDEDTEGGAVRRTGLGYSRCAVTTPTYLSRSR
jgi:hypothetical protein